MQLIFMSRVLSLGDAEPLGFLGRKNPLHDDATVAPCLWIDLRYCAVGEPPRV